MRSRDAHASIRGYIYQFNYSILELLSANEDAEITIEGIEDFDIHDEDDTTSVQCKYYQGTEYNHSKIAEAIRFMLTDYHFRITNGKPLIQYNLYGYFKCGQDKLVLPINIEFLKSKFLTYKRKSVSHVLHDSLELSDSRLTEFLAHLHINHNAEDFDTLFTKLINKIKETMRCDEFEAEHYYYNNALAKIADLAIRPSIDDRRITKVSFLNSINNRQILFNKWMLDLKGETTFIKNIKKKYFSELNINRKDRFFIIDVVQDCPISDILDLIITISRKYTNISPRQSATFCPYLYLNIDYDKLCAIREKLYEFGLSFVDGYPYHGSRFQTDCLHQEPNSANRIQLKIIENKAFLEESITTSKYQRIVYQFYGKQPIFDFDNPFIKHIKIATNNPDFIRRII